MAVLLARTAERLYWGARYVERAEDTARIVRAYHDLVVDYPSSEMLSWEPLAAIHGSAADVESAFDGRSGVGACGARPRARRPRQSVVDPQFGTRRP